MPDARKKLNKLTKLLNWNGKFITREDVSMNNWEKCAVEWVLTGAVTSDTSRPAAHPVAATGSTSHLCSLNPAAGRSRVFKKGDGHRRRTFKSVRTARFGRRRRWQASWRRPGAAPARGRPQRPPAPALGRRCVNFYRLKQVTPNAPQQQHLGRSSVGRARAAPGAGPAPTNGAGVQGPAGARRGAVLTGPKVDGRAPKKAKSLLLQMQATPQAAICITAPSISCFDAGRTRR